MATQMQRGCLKKREQPLFINARAGEKVLCKQIEGIQFTFETSSFFYTVKPTKNFLLLTKQLLW
jgi:hypothetical protein